MRVYIFPALPRAPSRQESPLPLPTIPSQATPPIPTAPAAFRPPADCDCGQPHKRVGGRHVCRYFGYFHCACGNRWTSAYTWKGEQQACRRCDRESAPAKTEKLDGRVGMGNGKPHDSSRCSMCAQLGYDCSI